MEIRKTASQTLHWGKKEGEGDAEKKEQKKMNESKLLRRLAKMAILSFIRVEKSLPCGLLDARHVDIVAVEPLHSANHGIDKALPSNSARVFQLL